MVLLSFTTGGCSSGGGGNDGSGIPGEELAKPAPARGTFFVDPNRSGETTRLHLVEMFWARLVDVHDVDELGEVNLEPRFRDFAINENIQSDAGNYQLETNPITQKTRLIIKRTYGQGVVGTESFDDLLRRAASGLPPIAPKHDDGSSPQPYSFVARNAALVLRFDDVLDDGIDAQLALNETVRLTSGYPPVTPFPSRTIFDPNHGAIIDGEFHSTRVLVDLTVSEAENSDMLAPQPVNAVGLPPSLTTLSDPNVSLRLPTRPDPSTGQFELLRALSGVPLASNENGPVDLQASTRDIVRAMRSGNPTDLNNGFLLDLNPPRIVGGWGTRIDRADPAGLTGREFLIDLTFTSLCRAAPDVGDVLSAGSEFLEVIQDSSPPDGGGQIIDLRVRTLGDEPLSGGGALLGNALFLSTFDPAEAVPPGCWISFVPQPLALPATDVSTSALVLARFSEPIDPASVSPFDTMYMVRGNSNTIISATNLVVAEISPSTDLKEFTLSPRLPLAHETSTPETYHVRVNGPTDLAGNALANQLPAVNFTLTADQAEVRNGGTVTRFNGTDEIEPIGLPDLRGQFFFDLDRGVIKPRPVSYTGYPADRLNPVPSIMIPFAQGVQTPLTPLGSKTQALWRYCDLGWQVLDETKYNLDVFGLSWAPVGGQVVSDRFEEFEIRLAHSRMLPDESIDANLLPQQRFSGLRGGPNLFTENILIDPLSPQKVVHPVNLGYRINSSDLFLASTGTVMLPYPLNRGSGTPVTFTWRDTAALRKAGPSGKGVPLAIEVGPPLSLEPAPGYVARENQVPTFGLPLLIEYRCYPSDTGIGLNALDVSLAINSSALPAFRAYSSGGYNTANQAVIRNPSSELVPQGGFNPGSTPPGRRTAWSNDNTFYIGQLDAVTRVSRVHTAWINTTLPSPDYSDPVVLPDSGDQPLGTEVIVEFRGATNFEIDDDTDADESTFPFDATKLNPYGEIYFVFPDPDGAGPMDLHHELLGSAALGGSVEFITGNVNWVPSVDTVDGAQYLQIRITFLNNIETGLNPELSAIGIAYSE